MDLFLSLFYFDLSKMLDGTFSFSPTHKTVMPWNLEQDDRKARGGHKPVSICFIYIYSLLSLLFLLFRLFFFLLFSSSTLYFYSRRRCVTGANVFIPSSPEGSVPDFDITQTQNVRAKARWNGTLEHVLPPVLQAERMSLGVFRTRSTFFRWHDNHPLQPTFSLSLFDVLHT